MKRIVAVAVVLLCASNARAAEILQPTRIGIGFHGSETPLGLRWWWSKNAAFDAGFGFDSDDLGTRKFTALRAEIGVPVRLASWERVGFYLRPGVAFASRDQLLPPSFLDTDKAKSVTASLRAEAEVFVVSRVSLSGSFGFEYTHDDNGVLPATDEWGTTGGNFTNLGFHIYFGGPR